MKKTFLLAAVALGFAANVTAQTTTGEDYTQYVKPLIGTKPQNNSLSGSVFPGACFPFGLVQLSPDTSTRPNNPASGYNYDDPTIVGFSHTHLNGTGVSDLFDFLVQPITGTPKFTPGKEDDPDSGYRSRYSHESEVSTPGYYSVKLTDYDIKAELTATSHVGFHKYTFPAKDSTYLMFDLDHSLDKQRSYWVCRIINEQVRLKDAYTLEGYRELTGWAPIRRIYFVAKFNKPVKELLWKDGNKLFKNDPIINRKPLRVALQFDTKSDNEVMVKMALSTTSYEGAYKNLKAELPGWDFKGTVAAAKKAWNKELQKIEIQGTEKQKEIFYTGMYRNFIQPNNLADVDGSYTGTDMVTHKSNDGFHYSTFSLWDTFRATHPLYTLIQTSKTANFINSMIRQYDTYGYLPIWQLWGEENYCMIGNHAIPVIADAILKDLPGFDVEKAYEACKASATTNHPGSPFSIWEKYHYFPENLQSQSVSLTLEDAFDAWCVAQIAKKLGHDDDYNFFMKQSGYYKNLYDGKTTFFRAKDDKGNWMEPFNPLAYGGNGGSPYTEGNAWQYFWFVPQDVPGLINLVGGDKQFNKKLDTMFTLTDQSAETNGNASGFIGQYAHGNEPSHHVAYLYDYSKQPWKTQKYVHQILTEQYSNAIDGLSGNEDCGQMSAWYIFSSMGFYPMNPDDLQYAIGSPILKNAIIHLDDNKTFTVKVKNAGLPYIKSVKLNGKSYNKPTLDYKDVVKGGLLEFTMSKKPNTRWGTKSITSL
ncbi:GH92 family glycosyl hydrolase [Zhouia sp. PK063]|uniref:GH92 family glycosyl hydrolase n=1 Tax=Zhouia sp. PK063 TaxID=3373602 RepID=UPI00378DF443